MSIRVNNKATFHVSFDLVGDDYLTVAARLRHAETRNHNKHLIHVHYACAADKTTFFLTANHAKARSVWLAMIAYAVTPRSRQFIKDTISPTLRCRRNGAWIPFGAPT